MPTPIKLKYKRREDHTELLWFQPRAMGTLGALGERLTIDTLLLHYLIKLLSQKKKKKEGKEK